MAGKKGMDFGSEVAKILPVILREATKRQATICAQGNISFPQIVILDLLREKGSCRMGELAKILHLSMGAVTGIVDKMIGLEYVERKRSVDDRRVVNVILIKKGKALAEKVSEDRRNMSNNMFAALTGKERQEYLRLLRKVYRSMAQ